VRFGSLFSGIGGMDLGLERAGMECAWQVEIGDYATRVLTKHWPNVPKYRDVREVGKHNLEPVDLICGGFPCQDISNAGKRAGIDGERSGLWSEFHRIICELRPRYVLVENVAALLNRGMGRVLGDLAEVGYDAEWDCIRASDFGASHERERLFIVAYPVRAGFSMGRETGADTKDARIFQAGHRLGERVAAERLECGGPGLWGGKVHGIPNRMDRIRGLGNAVYPDAAEWIGRRIIEA
jgi:DNA (cytosine-5)-methyltransferase 1